MPEPLTDEERNRLAFLIAFDTALARFHDEAVAAGVDRNDAADSCVAVGAFKMAAAVGAAATAKRLRKLAAKVEAGAQISRLIN